MAELWGVKVHAWLCNQLNIAAQGIILTLKLASLHFLLISLRLYVLRLIVMPMMTLAALTDAGLQGMLSPSALLHCKGIHDDNNEVEAGLGELQRSSVICEELFEYFSSVFNLQLS